MAAGKDRAAGEAAYMRADRALGGPPPKPARSGSSTFPVVGWLLNGSTPSLWVYSRLLLLLGVLSLLGTLLAGVVTAIAVLIQMGSDGFAAALTMLMSAAGFGLPCAAFLIGSAFVAYLAARNDREAGREVLDAGDVSPASEESSD